MKQKRIAILAFILVFTSVEIIIQSQELALTVHTKTGAKSYSISAIRNITFSGTNVALSYWNQSSEQLAAAEIANITFGILSEVESTSNTETSVYPNPTSDIIHIKINTTSALNVSLYTLDGIQLKNVKLSDNKSLDLHTLPEGIYLLKANGKIFKIAKQ